MTTDYWPQTAALTRARNLARNIGADLQGFGGILRCTTCGTESPLGDVGTKLAGGWPKCCGYTMRWVTQRQLDEETADQMAAEESRR